MTIKDNKKIIRDNEITDWFYMSPHQINAKMISDLLNGIGSMEVELWEEMNILQIILKDNKCIDFEPIPQPFKDSADAAFVKENNINTVFAITIDEDTFVLLKSIIKAVIEKWDGFLCSDSQDFKPILGIKELGGKD